MWNFRSKQPDYNRVFKSIKRRLNWKANWRDADLLYQQLSNDKSFKKELLRKAIHLSSLWIPAAIYFMPKIVLIPILSIILIGNIILEYGNFKKYSWARKSFGVLFFRTLRNKEMSRENFQFTGAIYVLTSAILCLCFFGKEIAMIALTVMLICDSAAALVGRSIGKVKLYKNKTLEGTLAFFVSAVIINLLFWPIYPFTVKSLIACLVATLAEVYEDKIEIDDNLSVPIFFSVILTWF
ncbi:MAG: phosphatidate cytidylyltransferase [Alphaproteobacteria bacterium]|nr:phosphatidate cytidylyltransferase [Alphaproteobacteria bacterium]